MTNAATAEVAVRDRPMRLRRAPLHVLVVSVCALWLVPTIALGISSLRPADQVATTGWWTAVRSPLQFTVDNYRDVLGARNLGSSVLNSLLITIPATIGPIVVAAFAAFAIARLRFRGGEVMFAVIVGLLVVPIQATLVPVLRLLNSLDLTGTFVGIWLVHTGFTLPFAVYLLRNFFAGLPAELFESARLDGATELQVFFRLALPLSRPALASLAIFQFLWIWNDLLAALIFLGGTEEVAPVTLVVSNLVSSRGEGWQTLTAAAFVAMALPLAVFLVMQRHFVSGLLAGATKG
jgi:alpha-glucoside transport system permease protein